MVSLESVAKEFQRALHANYDVVLAALVELIERRIPPKPKFTYDYNMLNSSDNWVYTRRENGWNYLGYVHGYDNYTVHFLYKCKDVKCFNGVDEFSEKWGTIKNQ